jgi:hypothetical protein
MTKRDARTAARSSPWLPVLVLAAGCSGGSGTTDDGGTAEADVDEDAQPEAETEGHGEADDDASVEVEASDGGEAEAEADAEAGTWDEPFAWTSTDAHECPPTIGPDDRYGELLEALGYDRSVGIPRATYSSYGGRIADDDARLSCFHGLAADPDGIPCWAGNLAARADAAAASDHPLAAAVAQGAAEIDRFLSVGGRLPPIDYDEPLVAAIRAVHAAAGAPFDAEAEVRAAAADVPDPVQRAAARVLGAAVDARAMRDEGIANMGTPDRLSQYYGAGSGAWLPLSSGAFIDPDRRSDGGMFLGTDGGSGRLFEGAVRLAQAIDEADWDAAASDERFSFVASTPWGLVVLGGGADDTYDPEALAGDVLLLVDTGGDDTYLVNAGGSGSADNPISVAIDLGGNDRYAYPEVPSPGDGEGLLPSDRAGRYAGDEYYGPFALSYEPRQGAGVTGYGFLVDRGAGSDTYRTLRRGQGFASFGVGVLWDEGGDDDYECEAGCQGSALVGIAVLHDGGGSDTYRAFNSAQGFAWVSSYGLLHDAAGNDAYEAVVDAPVVYYSPQLPGTANSSTSQGVAFGWRRDDTGTHLSGGVALLRDAAGDDTYTGAVFVQGTGYWFGLGVLADAGGSDHYDGLFYAQGAGAHFAIGALLDGGRDADFHNTVLAPRHSMMGLGHDYSASVLVDDGGDDTYVGPSRSIGAAKCHGFGLFADNAGNDSYTALDDKAIGWATDYDWAPDTCGTSNTRPSYGFFVDTGGDDAYVKPDPAGYGDDMLWITQDPDDPEALEISGGIDAADGDSYLRAYGEEGP